MESSLIVEYSRMQLHSLSSGCEIAQFFVRHTDDDKSNDLGMKILEAGTKDVMRRFEALFNGSWPKLTTHALESASNIRISSAVHHSQIVVWGA